MSIFAEETIAALSTLFERVAALQEIHIRDLLLPDRYEAYRATLDAAYDALVQVEDALDTIGMKLEYQHWRISSAFEEIQPLLMRPRSPADTTLDSMQQGGKEKRSYLV